MSRITLAVLAAPALHPLRLQASLSGASNDYRLGSPECATDKPLTPLGGRIADMCGEPALRICWDIRASRRSSEPLIQKRGPGEMHRFSLVMTDRPSFGKHIMDQANKLQSDRSSTLPCRCTFPCAVTIGSCVPTRLNLQPLFTIITTRISTKPAFIAESAAKECYARTSWGRLLSDN